MVTRRTSQPADTRLDDLPPVPIGAIPAPRAGSDPEPPVTPEPGRGRGALRIGVPVVAAVGLGAAALLGSGSGSDPGSGSPSEPAGGRTPTAVPRSAAELGFLKIVRQRASFAFVPDDPLIKVGLTLCEQLRAGQHAAELGLGGLAGQYTVEDVSTVVGAAAGAFCPDQMIRVGEPD